MLEYLKNEVCAIAKKAQVDGLCMHKSGNFSSRDKETGYFVITPSAIDRDHLAPRDMIVMDLEYNVIENESNLKPSSEVMVHTAIYKKRPDIMSIVHTHSHYATAFAVLNKPIPAVVYEIVSLNTKNGEIPVAPYQRPGTLELGESIANAMLESDAVLMEKHGAIAGGSDIQDAYLRANYLEDMAKIYHFALTANNGVEPNPLPKHELQSWEYPKEIKFTKK